MSDINQLADECWQIAEDHGFHTVNNAVPQWCANLHGEVSELWEAFRAGKLDRPCDKMIRIDSRLMTCAEEELADIVIRAFDVAVQKDIDIEKAIVAKCLYNKGRPHLHGGKKA